MTVSFQVTPEQLAVLEAARDQLAAETGARATVAAVVMTAVGERWRSEPVKRNRTARRVVPQLVYVKCPDCTSGAVHTDDGLVPVSDEALREIEQGADVRKVDVPTVGVERGLPLPSTTTDSQSPASHPWSLVRDEESRASLCGTRAHGDGGSVRRLASLVIGVLLAGV